MHVVGGRWIKGFTKQFTCSLVCEFCFQPEAQKSWRPLDSTLPIAFSSSLSYFARSPLTFSQLMHIAAWCSSQDSYAVSCLDSQTALRVRLGSFRLVSRVLHSAPFQGTLVYSGTSSCSTGIPPPPSYNAGSVRLAESVAKEREGEEKKTRF